MPPSSPSRVVRLVCTAVLAAVAAAAGQDGTTPRPGARPVPYPVTPPPEFRRAVERETRTDRGTPGPAYWQQWAAYRLDARLDPSSRSLHGTADIVYRNASPDTLPAVFLHLHQNLHAPGAVRNREAEVTGGVTLHRVAAGGTALEEGAGYRVQGTILGVRLPQPLRPADTVALQVEWSFTVPESGVGRMGWNGDDLFFLAYWYPQVAVYDDVVGWHLDPYLGDAEFYAGFGTYDLTVRAPEGWVVQGTGSLENAGEVLHPAVRERLARAASSDTVVHVVTEADLAARTVTLGSADGTLRWRFRAAGVRDVAFTAVAGSLWDAARTPVGDRDGDGAGDYALSQALFRPTAPRWRDAWRYGQHAIDFLSRWTGIPYPWPHMTAVEGGGIIGGGMEFPMMTLIGDYNGRSDSALYWVTAHELAHMWVPMIVGVDERRRAWMDEGTTTFNENQARKEFYPGVDHDAPDRDAYLGVARGGLEGEMMRHTDYHYSDVARGIASYQKPATVLAALRSLLGEETFLRAYRGYLSAWAYRHPTPWDFFNAFEAAAGRDLDWFWRTWYYETWTLDHAVASVTQETGRVTIVIEDLGLAPMPARVAVALGNGEQVYREVPVEHWLAGARRAELVVETDAPVLRVAIDPEGGFPDADRANNVWPR